MLLLIFFLCFASIAFLCYALIPIIATSSVEMQKKQAQQFNRRMDRVLQPNDLQAAQRLYLFGPLIFSVAAFILCPSGFKMAGTVAGLVLGFIVPRTYIGQLIQKRKSQFKDQLMDALMIMSSSFRGGLSLIQAIEAVTEEMPDPVRHEFGIVLGENKMGVSLDESLNRMYRRMPSAPLQQMITAVILSRETGGNLPAIFSRIVTTIRERKKIEQNLKTLTVQGKIQAVVMTLLPLLFVVGVSGTNRKFFEPMLKTQDGHMMLIAAVGLWVVGAFFVWKISAVTDY